MVKVREDHPVKEDGKVDIDAWLGRLSSIHTLQPDDYPLLYKACETSLHAEDQAPLSDNRWSETASSFRTGLEMAEILADLHLDCETLQAAILYRAVREKKLSLDFVETQFGEGVAKLIRGVIRMAAISSLRNDSGEGVFGSPSREQTEKVRKMLVAMVDDVRVALVKLAERTCAIRAVKNAPEAKRRKVAREVSDVYAPLAHRLGIGHIKWELEDLAFRYLEPDDYMAIARLLDERRVDRQQFIHNVVDILTRELESNNIHSEISGRAKHIYSIWRKMRRKDIGFSQVYDIRAVRILVPTVRDCYAVLGIVHSLWRNIPNEFDDYIASPKENGYRSLHTAVIGPDRKVLEVQIRTRSMHEEAEFGVCAHWRYKGADEQGNEDSYEQKIAWLRQVLEWHEELGGQTLQEDLSIGVEQDRIYVFTPDGHIIDFPKGSTPLDFAYRVHTEIGHRCRGAKVNGRIVPLNYALKTADQVEVLTGKQEAPSRDWLSPGLGYLKTGRARAKVQHWFKLQARDQNIAEGRAVLDKEFRRLAVDGLDYEQLAKNLNLDGLDDLYAAVGASDLGVGQVINAAQRMLAPKTHVDPVVSLVGKASQTSTSKDLFIDGVGNLLTHIAGCCNPVPGDAIIGYITLGRGVSIHKQDCHNMLQLQSDEPERIIKVDWSEAPQNVYSVEVMIEAFDRHGLLRDITALLDAEKINISAMQTLSDKRKNTVDMMVTLEIGSFEALSKVLSRLNQLPNVASARRKHN
ncbi:MAG: GTP diphosphokinase [Gammaproteobacteria bacterium]|uniref:GTP diphosphokinase n=1 Tax=Pseudomaricurvus alcaniphilus TaxID=1166482 RepID=UPI00140D876F|nr:GTP diphosphokinase [Pseudomaricurvus alcaniphilus]MBR9912285.1 GTP diphosphokinase [Gammaproteobacteria bacterium]NHN39357.1 GTP diphosphokinase [Pseudomaricurvus alcaniphilus]